MRKHTTSNQNGAHHVGNVAKAALALTLAVALAMPTSGLIAPQTAYADKTAAEVQAEAQSALASLNAMQASLEEAVNNHYAAEQELAAAQEAMEEAQARIDELEEELSELQARLAERARNMYRSGATSFLDILLGATSFEVFATLWDLLNELNRNDADLMEQVSALQAEVEEEKAEYEYQAELAAEKEAEAAAIADEAQATVDAMQAVYDSLSEEAERLLEEERQAELAAQEAAAQQAVEDAIAAAQESQSSSSGSSSSSSSSSSGSSSAPSYNAILAAAIVERAYACIGLAYSWGAVGPNSFDCSGLVSYCVTGSYTRIGTTYTFMTYAKVSDPQPGDIAVNSGHCGIYIGNGQMIHAPGTGRTVTIGSVQSGMVFVRIYS